jgi:IS6 family transposase
LAAVFAVIVGLATTQGGGNSTANQTTTSPATVQPSQRPMRGLIRFRSAEVIAAGHAFVQNLRRGHYELATDASPQLRLARAFTELAVAM